MAAGFLLGLIGTAIAYAVQGEPEPPAPTLLRADDAECRYAYSDAFRRYGKSKKQNSALAGGLVGTVIAVVIIAAAYSGN